MDKFNLKAKDGAVIGAVSHHIDENDKKGVVIISHGFGRICGYRAQLRNDVLNGAHILPPLAVASAIISPRACTRVSN